MKIYVLTRENETVAILDNSLPGALHYFDDEFHRYLDTGAGTFDLSVSKKHQIYTNASKGTEDDFQYLKENHFLVFRYKDKDFKFTIRRIEETETSLRLFCEDLSFDLLNEYRGPYKADKAYPMAKYINDCLTDSGYVIGINEFAKNERTLTWDGDATVLERTLSIANSFSAEIEFETILNSDRSVKENRVNLLKRVGVDCPDVELKYGREVNSIRRNVDITELITAIKPRGHEEDGKVTTIKNVEKTVYDDNGNEFFTKKGSEYIFCPTANQIYGNPKNKAGGYIVGQFSYDTKSDTELFNRAQAVLQQKCVPAYEFEIQGYYDVNIGDTIRAIDEAYNPILLLEARVSEQAICFSDPTKNKTVYINYKILENKVNQALLDRIDEVKKYAEQINKTFIFTIENTGSPMFTNGMGEVTFTAKIERNNEDITADYTKFNWVKQKKDGSLDEAWNATHQEIGKTLTVKPADFDDTATFTYQTLDNDVIIGGASGIVTKVYDGENGKTPIKGVDYFDGQDGTDGLSSYLHIRYSQNANGNPMTESPNGAKYIGMQPSQNPNASTVPADYSWSLFTGKDGIPGETGADGKTSYLHIRYSNDGGKTFTGNSGEDAGAWMGQYVDFTKADSNDVKAYTWYKIEGESGKDGLPGKDGVGIKDTAFAYQASTNGNTPPTGTWSATVPSVSKGQYLWTRTTWNYTDNSNEVGYSVAYVAKDGNNGSDGIAGKDGVGIKDTNVAYAKSTTGTTAPTTGWTATVPSVPDGQFLWTKTVWTYTDNTNETGYSVAKMGVKGDKGDTGPKGDPGNQGIPGTPGADGRTPYFHTAYAWSADGTDRFTPVYPQENLWLGEREYYWEPATYGWNEYTGIRPTDNGVKFTGATFVTASFRIKTTEKLSTEIKFQLIFSKNGVRQYVYNTYVPRVDAISGEMVKRTIDITEYSAEINKVNIAVLKPTEIVGEEFSISDIKIELGENTDPIYTPAPTEDYANAYPTYTGTYTDYTAADSTNPADYTWVRILGEAGQDGKDGIAGKDGIGIKSTAVTYQASTSGTTPPTGTWSTTIPSVAANQYLWTKTVLTYTNNQSSTAYSVGKMGANGANGAPGATGATGAQGPQGKPGTNGSNGVSVSAVVEEYYVSTSPTGQAGGTWSTTVPNNADPNKYIWRRMKTTLSNNTVTYTNPVLIQGMTGIYPYIGPTQPASPKEGQQWWKSDASGNITNFYVYKSGSWQGQTIQQSILNIVALNAVTITGSTITGTTINGSKLMSSFTGKTLPGQTNKRNGEVAIENGQYTSMYKEYGPSGTGTVYNSGLLRMDEYAFFNAMYDKDGAYKPDSDPLKIPIFSVNIQPQGLVYTDKNYPTFSGRLTFQDSLQIPKTLVTAVSGWAQYTTDPNSGNAPMASRSGRVVQLSGAFKNNAVIAADGNVQMGTLPVWARPDRTTNVIAQASYNNRYLLTVEPNGQVKMSRHSANGSNLEVDVGSWLNIACTFSARDM